MLKRQPQVFSTVHIRFKHSFNDMERGGYQSCHSFTYTAIDLKGFDLPKNLIINIF
jgi:hypothetical protein